jgi:hypothetical protein
MKPYMQKLMEKWLLDKASCPVRFSWKDIGGLFWPRWIKLGECMSGNPCSWPPGMHCVPAESHTIYVLRWHCRKRKRQGRKLLHTPPKVEDEEHLKGLPDDKKARNNGRPRDALQDVDGGGGEGGGRGGGRGKKRARDGNRRNRNRDRTGGVHCKWLTVPYPVTSECYCSC